MESLCFFCTASTCRYICACVVRVRVRYAFVVAVLLALSVCFYIPQNNDLLKASHSRVLHEMEALSQQLKEVGTARINITV